jgi:hypothetical protein
MLKNQTFSSKETFKKLWTTAKDNLAILVAIPTVLGGIWQIVSLASLSFSYIRFFSISQLLPDGIIISIHIASYYLLYLLIRGYDRLWSRRIIIDYSQKTHGLIKGLILYVFAGSSMLYLLLETFPKKGDKYNAISFAMFGIGLYWIYAVVRSVESIILILLRKYLSRSKRKTFPKTWELIYLVGIVSGLYFMYILLFNFNRSFVLPDKNENFKNLVCSLEQKDTTSLYEIVYMNDMYLFLNQYNKDSIKSLRSTIMFKNEILFEDNICNSSFDINSSFKRIDNLEEKINQRNARNDSLILNKIRQIDSLKKILNQRFVDN